MSDVCKQQTVPTHSIASAFVGTTHCKIVTSIFCPLLCLKVSNSHYIIQPHYAVLKDKLYIKQRKKLVITGVIIYKSFFTTCSFNFNAFTR